MPSIVDGACLSVNHLGFFSYSLFDSLRLNRWIVHAFPKKKRKQKRGVLYAQSEQKVLDERSNICRHAEQSTMDLLKRFPFFPSIQAKNCFFLFQKIDPITKAIEISAIKFRLRFTFSIVHSQTMKPT